MSTRKSNLPRKALPLLLALPSASFAGAFISSQTNPQQVMHPAATASGGNVTLRVCLDPASLPTVTGTPETDSPDQAIRNALARFNAMQPSTGNVLGALGQGVPSGRFDFESVMLHELGHCVGLDHNVLGPSEVSCSLGGGGTCGTDPAVFATISAPGANASFDVSAGTDSVRASRDDVRGDDVNRHWFRSGVNNPFETPPAVVDRQNYTVTTSAATLPAGHSFAEASTHHNPCSNPSSSTSSLPGRVAATSSVMFPVLCGNNVIRQLAPDDVATLRIARAGRDGVQGNSDDYAINLTYAGRTTSSCDLIVRFESDVGFGLCNVSFGIVGNNATISSHAANSNSGRLRFGRSVNWFFNQADTTNPPSANLGLTGSINKSPAPVGDNNIVYSLNVANAGPSEATGLQFSATLPAGTNFASRSAPGWTCNQSAGTETCTRASLASGASAPLSITVALPNEYAGSATLNFQASVSSTVQDPQSANNSLQLLTPVDFLAATRIFGGPIQGGFESTP